MNERERHDRASALFLRLRELPEAEREALLEAECGDEPELHQEVRSLLASDAADDGAFDRPALGEDFRVTPSMVGAEGDPSRGGPPLPDRIADYVVTGLIGAGGMGIVYRARQRVPEREVAVKVVRPDVGSSHLARRLAREAQVLAHLQHEGIAKVFDAGVFDNGAGPQPFFVMELIEGTPLMEHARERGLTRHARLELFATLCDAVHHAHQKGVVHRDLKPANVLVTAGSRPKVLDFGIARAVDSDLSISTLQTEVGQIVGTVPYMSPEQVSGDASRIDVRSDVYALGVLLYELLAERLPHDLSGATLPEAARIIRDEPPTKLSSVHRGFRGDLDTIAATAIDKEPQRRYPSAAALADDVRRHLQDQPIAARPPSAVYQLRKFARRNRVLVGAVAAVFVALVAGIVGTSVGLARAIEARAEAEANENRAESQLAKSERVTAFLRRLLEGSSPWIAVGRDTELLRGILDDAAASIGTTLADHPEAEIVVRTTIGSTFLALEDHLEAAAHLERAHELARPRLAADDESLLEIRRSLARLRVFQGDPDAGVALLQENLTRRPFRPEDPRPEAVADVGVLLIAYDGLYQWKEVIALSDEVLPPALEAIGQASSAVQLVQMKRAEALMRFDRYEEAESLYWALLDQRRAQLGGNHPSSLIAQRGLASVYRSSGRLAKARPLYEEYLEACLELFGEAHTMTSGAKNSLALLYRDLGRYDEAIALMQEVVQYNRTELGDNHQHTLVSMYNLGSVFASADRHEEAEQVMRERLDVHARHFGPAHEQTLLAQANLAGQQIRAGRLDTALELQADAIATARDTEGFDPSFLGYFLLLHGQALVSAGHLDEAEPALLDGWDLLVVAFTTDHQQCRDTALALLDLYEQLGWEDEAARWRATAEEIGAQLQPEDGSG